MKCPQCEKPMEVHADQAIMGDRTCCGNKYEDRKTPCLQKDHKNYVCKSCKILAGKVRNE